MKRIYLDHCATTPVSPGVAASMQEYFTTTFGNPSSAHRFGQEARAALDGFRARIAALLGMPPGALVFVSGGTEADNHALKGIAADGMKSGKTHIVTDLAEHHAVLDTCDHLEEAGFAVTRLPVDGHGMVSPDDVRKAITPRTALVSVMHANNEVGTVNPIAAIAAVTRAAGVTFHSDAVQSFGKIPLPEPSGGPDLLSISAHKIYGPKGIGGLAVRRGVKLGRLLHGGGQERGARGGTENVALAAGFAAAAAEAMRGIGAEAERLRALRDELRDLLLAGLPGLIVNGHPGECLPGVLNVSLPPTVDIDGEALLFNLDMAGIAASSGSACTSGSLEPSHVLLAIGRSRREAAASLRLSLGAGTGSDDIHRAAEAIVGIVRRIGTPVR